MSKRLYPSDISYVRLWSYLSLILTFISLHFAIKAPVWVLISAITGTTVMCLSYNIHAVCTFKSILKPIDDELGYLYYYDKSTVTHRAKVVIELLYVRQERAKIMRGAMFEDKKYPHIDNFNLLKCLDYKLKGIVPDEFWVQK